MPLHEERSVRIDGGIVVWDGIKSPESIVPTDGTAPFNKFTLKIVVPPTSPDLAILDGLGAQCLQESVFKGQLPAGGHWIMKQVGPQEFDGMFPGWWCVNGITYQPPQVFDEQGVEMQSMQYGPLLYTGQRVNMLVSAKDYNQKSKGIKAQLEGFQIVASANAPRISTGGTGVSAASAFGGAPSQAPAQQGYGAPSQAPAQQGYGAPSQGAHQNPPAYGAGAPNAATPQGGASATTSPSNAGPNQAHNFLPGQ